MDRETFAANLERATAVVVPFTREYVRNRLPDEIAYLVYTNQSYDGNAPIGDEELFPLETMVGDPEPCDPSEVVSQLYRHGKVPEWINVTVERADDRVTYLRLNCCGRFTAKDDLLYHTAEGYPPFHCLGPALPPGWKNVEQSGKFDLYWSQDRGGLYRPGT